jgi:hypothetical protein
MALRQLDGHRNFTRIGEFHRVSNEIHQYLSQTSGIAGYAVGNVCMNEGRDFKSLTIGLLCQELYDVLNRGAQLEIKNFEIHLARFNFGKV